MLGADGWVGGNHMQVGERPREAVIEPRAGSWTKWVEGDNNWTAGRFARMAFCSVSSTIIYDLKLQAVLLAAAAQGPPPPCQPDPALNPLPPRLPILPSPLSCSVAGMAQRAGRAVVGAWPGAVVGAWPGAVVGACAGRVRMDG